MINTFFLFCLKGWARGHEEVKITLPFNLSPGAPASEPEVDKKTVETTAVESSLKSAAVMHGAAKLKLNSHRKKASDKPKAISKRKGSKFAATEVEESKDLEIHETEEERLLDESETVESDTKDAAINAEDFEKTNKILADQFAAVRKSMKGLDIDILYMNY